MPIIPFDPGVYPLFSQGERVLVKQFGVPGLIQGYNALTDLYRVTVLRPSLPTDEQEKISGAIAFYDLKAEELIKL